MLRVKDEEFSLRERRENSHHRRRHYSDDYDSEAELYEQYKAAGMDDSMVGWYKNQPFYTDNHKTRLLCGRLNILSSQAWASEDEDEPIFSPVVRKKAIKVKHVKRREKKFDKKVSNSGFQCSLSCA